MVKFNAKIDFIAGGCSKNLSNPLAVFFKFMMSLYIESPSGYSIIGEGKGDKFFRNPLLL
jgi:hypothetical protein